MVKNSTNFNILFTENDYKKLNNAEERRNLVVFFRTEL